MKIPRALILSCIGFLAPAVGSADVITDVRMALARGDFRQADAMVRQYQAQHGATPEMLEALSWVARGELAAKQIDKAEQTARQTQHLAVMTLSSRPLDAEPHLPIALGAAIEVQAQATAARGERAQAVGFLQQQIALYNATSIATRLQKNLNLLTLEGKPAPGLDVQHYLGPKPASLAALRGKPVLLFFWAHWCMDCRAEEPLLAKLKSEYQGRGLTLLGPTQLYGYAARGLDATPQQELAYIDEVRKTYYGDLSEVPAPVSAANFKVYGASTTPTLVLVDRKGIVRLYHPGRMTYEELAQAINMVMQ